MLKRLVDGLVIGTILGGIVAATAIHGLGIVTFNVGFSGVLAYLIAAGTGVLTGLVAGKPIWSKGGQIEAGLKAVAGGLVGAGLMWALRTWAGMHVDLSSIGAGSGAVGMLPATSLPIVAALLGGFFEVDNTGSPDEGDSARKGVRVATRSQSSKAGVRVASDDDAADEDEVAPTRSSKKR